MVEAAEAAEEAEAVAAGRGTAGQNYLQPYWNKSILPMVCLKHGSGIMFRIFKT